MYKNFVRGTRQQTFRRKLSFKCSLVILKENMLFRAITKPKVNVQLHRLTELGAWLF